MTKRGDDEQNRTLPRSVYEHAERIRVQHRDDLVLGQVHPTAIRWVDAGARFLYSTQTASGNATVLVDPHASSRSVIGADEVDALPIWSPADLRGATAPDGSVRLEVREYDLWLTDAGSGEAVRLTDDGEEDLFYGTDMSAGNDRAGHGNVVVRAIVHWSPDGAYALTQRTDLREVGTTYLLESSPAEGGRPRLHTYRDAYPGDTHVPLAELLIVDVRAKTIRPAAIPPLVATHSSPLRRSDVWWGEGNRIYVLHSSRDWLTLTLYAINPATGEAAVLVEEQDTMRVRPSQQFHQRPNVRILAGDDGSPREVIWYSLRDGWGHLYLYDAMTGEVVRQITSGEWGVEEILRVDAGARTMWIAASGLVDVDPLRRQILAVDLDTGALSRVTNDGSDHRVMVPPTVNTGWFIDWASTVNEPPVVTVRDWTGDVLLHLDTADISPLLATGWTPPERFVAMGADGVTPIYGTLFLPPAFDPARSYPVVDHLYPGPQVHRGEPFFAADEAEPFAALGMVAVAIDGRGTPGRSRAFHNASWRNVGAASGIEDHVAVLRELAATRPWLDLTSVGVVGHSAGGFAVTRAMELFPEFFKVGVAQAGRHDGRLTMAMILEAYDGPPDAEAYARASAVESAGDITGKLLLIHGEMDTGVPLAQSLRVIERMIEANRDVDLIVIPGDNHSFTRYGTYVERRTWDYLARHLLGMEPPSGFAIG